MGADDETLDFYDREAAGYADYVEGEVDGPWLARFAGMVAPGGRVLDFGCGPGWAANYLKAMGFRVEAFDGSAGLAREAKARYGIEVTVGRFEEFAAPLAHFDGIWCSFSLLHDSRAAFAGHVNRLAAALAPGGALYLGVKEGTGEDRDDLGRRYTYFGRDEVRQALEGAGFSRIALEVDEAPGFSGEVSVGLHFFTRRG